MLRIPMAVLLAALSVSGCGSRDCERSEAHPERAEDVPVGMTGGTLELVRGKGVRLWVRADPEAPRRDLAVDVTNVTSPADAPSRILVAFVYDDGVERTKAIAADESVSSVELAPARALMDVVLTETRAEVGRARWLEH